MTNANLQSNNGIVVIDKQPSVTGEVLRQITKLQQNGYIEFPLGYNPGNALNAARLALENVKNAQGRSIIVNGQLDENVVTRNSVVTALHKYVSLALNTDLDQAYFLVYGNSLQCQRSYHGEQYLAKRLRPEIEFYSDTVRKGETIALKKVWSKRAGYITVLEDHTFAPDRDVAITGAYCGAVDTTTGEDLGLIYLGIDEIKKHWAVNKSYKPDGNGIHQQWAHQMAVKVAISKRAKSIYKSAADSRLKSVIQKHDDDAIEAEIAEDAAQNANKETLSLPAAKAERESTIDTETGEIVEGGRENEAPF